jgi:hypothetical protein
VTFVEQAIAVQGLLSDGQAQAQTTENDRLRHAGVTSHFLDTAHFLDTTHFLDTPGGQVRT